MKKEEGIIAKETKQYQAGGIPFFQVRKFVH
jgi:hypothetical protein